MQASVWPFQVTVSALKLEHPLRPITGEEISLLVQVCSAENEMQQCGTEQLELSNYLKA